MPAPSYSFNLTTNRDGIITRALRIIGAIGQGETPNATAITEAAEALNDLVKEWEADGMAVWALRTYGPMTFVASTNTYTVGVGATGLADTRGAPLKVYQAWIRDTQNSPNTDSPANLITREAYNLMGSKSSTGTPSLVWYNPPGELNSSSENAGTITVYPTPDANAVAYLKLYFTGIRAFSDFDSSTDVPDFPQYWFNAVKWGLADQLAYEYGVGLSERAMINKKAMWHKEQALSFGTEEGSLFLTPRYVEEQ